jgi:P27 family predicted phage terminase small subunit
MHAGTETRLNTPRKARLIWLSSLQPFLTRNIKLADKGFFIIRIQGAWFSQIDSGIGPCAAPCKIIWFLNSFFLTGIFGVLRGLKSRIKRQLELLKGFLGRIPGGLTQLKSHRYFVQKSGAKERPLTAFRHGTMPTPKKSKHDHWLTGSVSQATQPNPEHNPEGGRPRYPVNVSTATKKAFKRLVAVLETRRSITPGDADILRLYAVVFDRHTRALNHLQREGEIVEVICLDGHGVQFTKMKANLWLKIAQDSEKAILGCLDRLGLTPLAKSKVRPAQKSDDDAVADDPMTALFRNRPAQTFLPPTYVPVATNNAANDISLADATSFDA